MIRSERPERNMSPAQTRRIAIMLAGILIMGLGVALFKISRMGNDPSTALTIAIGDRIGVDFSIVLIVANFFWFLAEWHWNRRLIGIGTFVNWFMVGPLASLFERAILNFFAVPASFIGRLPIMITGILVLSLSCALYQTSDVGIAPYDALSITLSQKTEHRYFRCRILTDSICVIIAFALGGIIGLGTLTCALGLGPFIQFFTQTVARPLLGLSRKTV